MWLKLIPFALVFISAFLAGQIFQQKVLNQKIVIPPCPNVTVPPCPPQTKLDLQSFDVRKIKNIRTFTYSPSISGDIQIVVDSATYQRLIGKDNQ